MGPGLKDWRSLGSNPQPLVYNTAQVVGWYFHFYSNSNRLLCKHTETLHCMAMSHKKDARLKWVNYPQAFFKKRRGYCNRLRPYVCPSFCQLCYLLLNHWTKSNQIWCVRYSHEWGMQQQKDFSPRPLGRGQKVKYH